MIDPWKFNPISILGKNSGELSTTAYTEKIISVEPELKEKIMELKQQIAEGKRTIIENSNELFL